MKKRTLNAGILTAMIIILPILGNVAEASTLNEVSTQQATQQSTTKIMWGANELADTQIGRITFLNDTKLYKRDGKNPVQFHLVAKEGSMWRVHKITKEGSMNVYDLGGGVRVQQSNLSRYEAVPTALIEKQVKENGVHITWVNKWGVYPQVRRLASKDAEDKINKDIEHYAEDMFRSAVTVGGGLIDEFKVTENKNNRLEVSFSYYSYNDENGIYGSNDVKLRYDLTTGNPLN